MIENAPLENEAAASGEAEETEAGAAPPGPDGADRVPSYPTLVFLELLAALAVTAFFILLSVVFDAPLEGEANPAFTPAVTKAPWYFVGLQELLVYFDPWMAGVVIPALIVLGLISLPFLEDSRGTGRSPTPRRSRRFGNVVFSVGLAFWFFLIVVGAWFRGEGWRFVMPWSAATAWQGQAVGSQSWSFSPLAGALVVGAYFLLVACLGWRFRGSFLPRMGRFRYVWMLSLLALMGGVFLKIALRLLWDVHYVVTTPWGSI